MQDNLPENIASYIQGEPVEFSVKAKRDSPTQWFMIFFGFFWLAISSIISATFMVPLLNGEEAGITLNGVYKTGTLDNMGDLILPMIFMGVFIMIGLVVIFFGVRTIFQKGSWYIGTKNRLIISKDNNFHSIDWEQFTGDVEIKGNTRTGSIFMLLRTGRMQSRKHGPSEYVADEVCIIGVPNILEIEAIVRKRIKENDPTPENIS